MLGWFKGKGPSGFGYNSTSDQVTEGLDLSGKTYLLTGCNSGIGLDTLRVLGLRGAHVIAAARSVEKAQEALNTTGTTGTPVACELSEPDSVRACVQTVKALGQRLDGMICNAGIMALPKLTLQHGYEIQFFTNHIGHFILVTGLLDRLTDTGRLVMVSSEAHRMARGIPFDNLRGEKSYSSWGHYGISKLANVLFARQIAKQLEGTHKTANAIHPGVIHTNLGRHMNSVMQVGFSMMKGLFLKSIPQGAATQCYVATHPQTAEISGAYFADCNVAKPTSYALDDQLAQQLWDLSLEIVASV